MVDHFHDQVVAKKKIDNKARAMVVTSGIKQAMKYKVAFDAYLMERRSPYKAIVAFSGEHEFKGERNLNEAKMNGFPSSQIPEKFREDPYRFLIVAEKFQTGFDEPLLHTMYVDKMLSDVKAVQTLSRLNRGHPRKHGVFVLDFVNNADIIEAAFSKYYRTTVLSKETDPNKLHDLKTYLERCQVYSQPRVEEFVQLYVGGADRDGLDPILDACVATYKSDLDEDGQVEFKSNAKLFVRTYSFLSAVLPYTFPEWEYLGTFLNFLNSQLRGTNQSTSPIAGFEAIIFDDDQLASSRQSSKASRSSVTIWSNRTVQIYDFEFPTQRSDSSQVDGGTIPKYQFHLEVEQVAFPAEGDRPDNPDPDNPDMVWARESFAVARTKDSAKYEEIPGYHVSVELEAEILKCLKEVLLVDPNQVKVLPVSSYDRARVGKRVSAHPLHETYIGRELMKKRDEFYLKAGPGTLVAEIDELFQSESKDRHPKTSVEPKEIVERVQRVFTTPIVELEKTWRAAAHDVKLRK